MKKLNSLLILLLVTILVSCNSSNAPSCIVGSRIKIKMKVEGMTCNGCEVTIQKKLMELTGVDSVKASYPDSTVRAIVDTSKSKIKAISEAIESAGYHMKEIKID